MHSRTILARALLPFAVTASLVTAAGAVAHAAPTSPAGVTGKVTEQTARTVFPYQMMNRLSGKCLTPRSPADGASVTQVGCDGSTNQQWLAEIGTVGTIVNRATGMCLTVPGADPSNGRIVTVSRCDGGPGQLWRHVPKDGWFYEVRPFFTDKCLDLKDDNRADGAVIQQWGCNPLFNANQHWLHF